MMNFAWISLQFKEMNKNQNEIWQEKNAVLPFCITFTEQYKIIYNIRIKLRVKKFFSYKTESFHL